MDAAATLVWIAPAPPDGEQSRALEGWGRAHGVALAPPNEGRPSPLRVDPLVSEGVEADLERAREALAARDGAGVERALADADAALRAQPQLPQGAWLMAEVLRARAAARHRLSPEDPSTGSAWLEAAALDGGRVSGLGEPDHGVALARASVAIEGVERGDEIRLDGAVIAGGSIDTTAGPHVLLVTAGGAPLWARWLDVAAGTSRVRVELPPAPACSRGDLAHVTLEAGGVSPGDVRCDAWVAAAPGEGGLRVATCAGPRCGALVAWAQARPVAFTPPPPKELHQGWPAWATWGLIGLGVVAAGTVAIVAGTASGPPAETRFVSGGVKSQ